MSSQGIEGQDIIPLEIWNKYRSLFAKYLPGWQPNGVYNYNAAPSTQMAAVQLNKLLHSGSHTWINEGLDNLFKDFEKKIPAEQRTTRIAQLVNFLSEAQNLDNPGSKTGGYISYASRRDPYLIKSLGYQPSPEFLRDYNFQNLDWDKIAATSAGQEVEALKPKTVNGVLQYEGKLNNNSFFSKIASKTGEFDTYGSAGSKSASSKFSAAWAKENGIKVVENGAVTVKGEKAGYDAAKAFLNGELSNGRTIGSYGSIPGKVRAVIAGNIGKLGAGVALVTIFVAAASAAEAQEAATYDSTKANAANKNLISEIVGTVAGQLGGLAAGALAGLVSLGALTIPSAIAASVAAEKFGKYLGDLFYDKFTEAANAAAEAITPLFSSIGSTITDYADALVNLVSDIFDLTAEEVYGREGLFGIDGPLFNGGPLQFAKSFLEEKSLLSNEGVWAYDGFDAILYGEGTDDVLIHEGWGAAYGGKGDDILVGWKAETRDAGKPLFEGTDSGEPTALKDARLILDGQEGNDWVIAFGGEKAKTVGGLGRDWIVNRSNGGEIYGDTLSGTYEKPVLDTQGNAILNADGSPKTKPTKVEDSAANSDNIWYSANTVVKDAQHHDFLKFYGLTLTGGNAEGGIAGLLGGGGIGAAAGLANFYASLDENGKYDPARSVYFDHLFPWMTYAFRPNGRGGLDMYVTNQFDQLFTAVFGGNASDAYKKQQALDAQGILKGWMKVENFDLVGSFIGYQQASLAGQGTFGMVFKAPNPIADLMTLLEPLLGIYGIALAAQYGGNVLIDQAITLSAAATRFAKGLKWADGADPLVIDLDGDGIETTEIATSQVYFDVDGDLFAERTGWLKGDDGFLVRDLNGNGRIDDVSEMFGGVGRSGFAQLAGLDSDGDGKITRADLLWAELKIWQDYDRDGVTDAGELRSLDQLGIVSLDLSSTAIDIRTPQGARLTGVGDVTFESGAVRRMFDAILASNDTDTRYAGEAGRAVWQPAETLDLKGFGRITNLSVAAANDIGFPAQAMTIARLPRNRGPSPGARAHPTRSGASGGAFWARLRA